MHYFTEFLLVIYGIFRHVAAMLSPWRIKKPCFCISELVLKFFLTEARQGGDVVVWWLVCWTFDLEVGGSSLCHHVLFPYIRNFTPHCLSSSRCMNGYQHSLGSGSLVGNKASRVGSGEGEGATEPGDMPFMLPICPPVIGLSLKCQQAQKISISQLPQWMFSSLLINWKIWTSVRA